MHSLSEQFAAIVANTDAVPRLVRQFTALFLVTPTGDVWRVFDSDEVTGEGRYSPSSDPLVRARVFVGSGPRPSLRLYEFSEGEARTINAEKLFVQLTNARALA